MEGDPRNRKYVFDVRKISREDLEKMYPYPEVKEVEDAEAVEDSALEEQLEHEDSEAERGEGRDSAGVLPVAPKKRGRPANEKRGPVRFLKIALGEEMYAELLDAVRACNIGSYDLQDYDPTTPEAFVRECVESVLASRRLDRADRARMLLNSGPRREIRPAYRSSSACSPGN